MKFVAVIFLSCIVAAYAAPRIIGGQDAPDGKYPYMVSLRRAPNSHLCGGSILNKRWILTAAHCVEGHFGNALKIVAGTNLIHGGEEQVYESEYIVAHKDWNKPYLNNDVGLIRVSKDIEFNEKVQPIALPKEDFSKTGHSVAFSGWGSMKLWGPTPNKLQEITLKLVDQEKCKKAFVGDVEINEGHICTFTQYGQGICHGDSGSPLVVDGVQIGVASFVMPCAIGSPDAYARVYTFLDWIAAEQAKF